MPVPSSGAVSPTSAPAVIAGRYRIDGPLGRGGMADVHAGTDLRLQRPVAIKVLLPPMAARDDIRRRFEAEALAAASFSDPHAVAVFDTGEHEGQPYIVMERLPGETLADRIAAGPSDPAWVRRVGTEVLGALGAAHAAGLVHRDVKPGNILITADDHAKIADFGIAKSLEGADGSRDLTGTGQLLGTPAYLPPERLDGGPATPKSDIYSLGVVLYEALTGRCPFPGDTPIAAARAIVAGEYEPIDAVRPGLDPALVTAVERSMATDPDRRFPGAAAMAAALAPVVTAGPTLVGPERNDVTSVIAVADVSGTRDLGPVVAEAPPRRRVPVPAALLIALLFVAVLVFALNRGDGAGTNQPVGAQTVSTQPGTTAANAPVTTVARQPVTTAPGTGRDGGATRDNGTKGKAKGKDD